MEKCTGEDCTKCESVIALRGEYLRNLCNQVKKKQRDD